MEDLDSLQLELETLLCNIVVDSRTIQRQLNSLDDGEKSQGKEKSSSVIPPSPPKRSKQDEKSPKKLKEGSRRDVSTPPLGSKPPKYKGRVETDDESCDQFRVSSSMKDDAPNRFWSFVDSYCGEITYDDIKLLDDLIETHGEDQEYMRIPPLGKHYTLKWAEEDMQQEQKESMKLQQAQTPAVAKRANNGTCGGLKDSQRVLDAAQRSWGQNSASSSVVCGPFTQRLVSALMDNNIASSAEDAMDFEQDSEGENTQHSAVKMGPSQASAIERQITRELKEQGIFFDEVKEEAPEDDEILAELRRCQNELQMIANHNLEQLKRLRERAKREISRQQLKSKLNVVDQEVVDLYKKLTAARQKRKPPNKKEKEQAWKALREREDLLRQLNNR